MNGEIVALDEHGKPSFNLLHGLGDAPAIVLYAFDLLMLHGKDVRFSTPQAVKLSEFCDCAKCLSNL